MHILIVEDSIKISEQLGLAFKEVFPDAKITVTDSIVEADELLTASSFDIISLDVMLPDGNGLELAKKLRLIPHLKDTVLLMITGVSDYITGFSAYDQARCYKYIIKPFKQQELLNTLFELRGMITCRSNETYFQFNNKQMSLRIKHSDILYAEMNLKSVTLFTVGNEFDLGRVSMKDLFPLLGDAFLQIHRSYIVNKCKVMSLQKNTSSWQLQLNYNELKLPVGSNFKESVSDLFG